MRKLGVSLVLLALLAGCGTAKPAAPAPAAGSAPPAAAPKPPIKIGFNVPLSGPNASIGQDYKEAGTLAIDQINARGGVLGRQIQGVFADNQCDNTIGVQSAGNLIDVEKVAAFIGSSCSNVTLAVMPVIEKSGIVQFTAGATNAQITQKAGVGGNVWQYRLNIDDSIMAIAFSKEVIAQEVKSVAIVGRNDDFGRGAAAYFKDTLTPLGVKVTSTEYFTTGQADFRPMLTKIKNDKPEGMIVIADAPDAGPMAVQSKELGMTGIKIYGRGTVVTPEFRKLVGDNDTWANAKEVNRWAPAASQFEKDYEAKYGRQPRVTAALPYYGVQVLAEAIKIAGSDDRTAIRDALKKVNISFPDLGPVKFDDHNQAHPDMFITAWQNGKLKLVLRNPSP